MIQLLQLRCQSQLRALRRVVGGLFFGGLGAAAFFQLGTLGDGQRAWHGEHEDQRFSPMRTWEEEGFIKESYVLSPLEQDAIADSEMFADHFGAEIATDGDRLFVGATRDCREGSNHGWVHRFDFEEEADLWVLKGDVSPVKRSPNSFFGRGMAVHEELLFVGAFGDKRSHQAVSIGKVVAFRSQDGQWIQSGDVVAPEMPAMAMSGDLRNLRQRTFGLELLADDHWLVIHADQEVSVTPKRGPLYLYRHGEGDMPELKQRLPDGDSSQYPGYFAKQFSMENGWLAVESERGAGGSRFQYDLYGYVETEDRWMLRDRVSKPEEAKAGVFKSRDKGLPVLFSMDGYLMWGDENGDWSRSRLEMLNGFARSQLVAFSKKYGLAYSVRKKMKGKGWNFVLYHSLLEDGSLNPEPLCLAPSLYHPRWLSDLAIADNGDILVGQREVSTGEYECGAVFVWRRSDLMNPLRKEPKSKE